METREQLYKEFKKDNPQTIGETDTAFDNDNFIDWLVDKFASLRSVSETKEPLSDPISNKLEQRASDYADELIQSKAIKGWQKSWMEAVYLFVAKQEISMTSPVPVSEVGQITVELLKQYRQEMFLLNPQDRDKATEEWIKRLPAPNTKTVEGEDIKEVSRLILLQVEHNKECGKDDKFTIDEISDIIDRRILKPFSSLRSNEPEREGKVEFAEYLRNRFQEQTNKHMDETAIGSVEEKVCEAKMEAYSDALNEYKKHYQPSPPLKALSEITDEDATMTIKLLFRYPTKEYDLSPDEVHVSNLRRNDIGVLADIQAICFEGIAGVNFNGDFQVIDEDGKIAKHFDLASYQYLQHKGYAVPVFYPVPEVKEKGDKE